MVSTTFDKICPKPVPLMKNVNGRIKKTSKEKEASAKWKSFPVKTNAHRS
jgi:hypothetical protein